MYIYFLIHTSGPISLVTKLKNIYPSLRYLGDNMPKVHIKTKSVCPECGRVIDAILYEENGVIYMKKTCPEHGEFVERIYDGKEFKRIEEYLAKLREFNPPKVTEPIIKCELCPYYYASPVLTIIDVTNRCNLRCSYCFANAAVTGYLYEPSKETIFEMLRTLREKFDPPVPSVMFSGGEPTMRSDLIDIVREAKRLGFAVLIATNGYKVALDKEYTKKLSEAGADILYLSFDGLTDRTNREKKNHKLIDKILQNCREANLGIVFVPTIIRGLNDDEVYKIVEFGLKNSDIVRGVNFQPISFTGKMSRNMREQMRYTISDLLEDMEKQSGGKVKPDDFYPIPSVLPLTELVESFTGKRAVSFSTHPLCGAATYLFKDENGNVVPITEFLDVDKFLDVIEKYSKKMRDTNSVMKKVHLLGLAKDIIPLIDFKKVPKNLPLKELLTQIILKKGDLEAVGDFHLNSFFVGTMHFQDLYNVDMERITHCIVHYMTPDMKTVSFCAYNGLGIREMIENKYKVQYDSNKHEDEESKKLTTASGVATGVETSARKE